MDGSFIFESIFKQSGFDISHLDTGGEKSLNNLTWCSPQHFHGEILNSVFDVSTFDFLLMSVRNPINRLKSEYLMRNRIKRTDPDLWVVNILKQFNKNPFLLDNHLRPQIEFLVRGVKIYKQENKFDQNWIDKIEKVIPFKLLGGRTNDLSRYDIDKVTTNDVVFSKETIKQVEEFYSVDFECFSY